MRLNKWLVLAGVTSSRRKADELVISGKILRNGHYVKPGEQVQDSDIISLNGEVLRVLRKQTHIITFYKPRGVISSHARQKKNTKIIFDYLPLGWQTDIIVGRLDKDSEGLVLLTNDGALAQRLTHPSFKVRRVYSVTTKRPLTSQDLNQLTDGIELEDGTSRALSATLDEKKNLIITLEEGRNRQIRRSLMALNHTVTRLVRLNHGPYQLQGLKPGEWRQELPPKEKLQ